MADRPPVEGHIAFRQEDGRVFVRTADLVHLLEAVADYEDSAELRQAADNVAFLDATQIVGSLLAMANVADDPTATEVLEHIAGRITAQVMAGGPKTN